MILSLVRGPDHSGADQGPLPVSRESWGWERRCKAFQDLASGERGEADSNRSPWSCAGERAAKGTEEVEGMERVEGMEGMKVG